MTIQNLHDDVLLIVTAKLVAAERELVTKILHHLREIERRRLFSKLGCKSLFDYAVKRLHYSEAQAYRRIATMRLLYELPELEEKLNSGSLSLTHVGLAQRFFRQEQKVRPLSKTDKFQILSQLENLSSRQVEKVVAQISSSPQTLFTERIRPISSNLSEVTFIADQELLDKIDKLKGLWAHKLHQATLPDLLHKLCDLALEKSSFSAPKKPCSRKISLRRQIFKRDQAKCQKCDSTFALQIDHIIPVAKGGANSAENLRVLCRNCNQRAAIEHYGMMKMGSFIN